VFVARLTVFTGIQVYLVLNGAASCLTLVHLMVLVINAILMKCVRTVAISRSAGILGQGVLGVLWVQHVICVELVMLHGVGEDLATFAIDYYIFKECVFIYI
jgi:hypothetical protein